MSAGTGKGAQSIFFHRRSQAPLKFRSPSQDSQSTGVAPETHSERKIMVNITRYSPFGDLVDDFLRGFVVRPVGFEAEVPVRRMKVDVAEQNGDYKVVAELPGVKKEDIKVNIDGDEVSITAETRVEKDAKDGERLLHSERYVGRIARAFRLAQEIDESRASARYSDGVLELTLPKKAAAAAKQLTIQ
jgi:HSP20 family protein